MEERRYIDFAEEVGIEQREGGEGSVLKGLGLVLGGLSKPMSMRLDSGEVVKFVEIIDARALDRADLSDVICCVDHTPLWLLGRTSSGTLRLVTDQRGVTYYCDMPPLEITNQVTVYVGRKDIKGNSYQFIKEDDRWEQRSDGVIVRTVTAISRMLDIGPVIRPAYTQTNLEIRSYREWVNNAGDVAPKIQNPDRKADYRARTILINQRFFNLKTTVAK
jgi:phage head maturation protease